MKDAANEAKQPMAAYSSQVAGTRNRKDWVKPELIVLVRYHREESVLSNCKYSGVTPHDPMDTFENCWQTTTGCISCDSFFAS